MSTTMTSVPATATTTTTTTTTPTSTTTTTTPLKVGSITIPKTSTKVNIAVVGCVHGELDTMYRICDEHQKKTGEQIHVLLCCGDFESTRNFQDLQCLAAPDKFREMVDFYNYYNGNKTAPILTLFTHGNHEASNYLMELPYGGWVAPNIYYLGFTNVISLFGIKIGGIGGICKPPYQLARNETCPLDKSTMRTLYYTREVDTWMIQQFQAPIDMMLSHDWPQIAVNQGNVANLLLMKPAFDTDVRNGNLGSRYHSTILQTIRPLYWFSAHLHCKYPAIIQHENNTTQLSNTTETTTATTTTPPPKRYTKFLALDKIKPGHQSMQLIQHPIGPSCPIKEVNSTIDNNGNNDDTVALPSTYLSTILQHFRYEPEWIAILQQSQPLYPRSKDGQPLKITTPLQYSPEKHKEFYSQFTGQSCQCITSSTKQSELFLSHDEMTKLLYPNMITDDTQQQQAESLVIPHSTFQQTAQPLLEQQQRRIIHPKHQNQRGRHHQQQQQQQPNRPPAEIPSFQLNPQTILFCNQFKLLVPAFFPEYQWCAPKHAAELYLKQQQQKQ